MIKKIGGVVLILILILGGFIFYGLFILDVDKEQQVQTSLDDSYYQVGNLFEADSSSAPNLNKNAYIFISTLNKNLLSKYLAIDIAENLLKLLPKKTHDFNLFLSPSKLQSISQKYNLNLMNIEGMQYNPIFKSFKLSKFDLVNYFGTLKY